MQPHNVPLDDTAVLSPRQLPHLSLMKDGMIILVFPRSTPYAKIEKMAQRFGATVYITQVVITYHILGISEEYNHEPRISM